MFDPRSYRDSDYGLDVGETFEPEDAGDVPLADTSLPHVMTVLGPIEPDELGVCLTHEYLVQGRPSRAGHDSASTLVPLDQAAQDLETFAFSGGRGVVDARTTDLGRDAAGLHQLAQRVPLHIIATTGRSARLQPGESLDAEAMEAELIRDLTVGMDGTPARSGLIALGMDVDGLRQGGNGVIQATARAHQSTGATVTVQSDTLVTASRVLEAFEKEGVAARRVILQGMGHGVSGVSVEEVIALAAKGAAVSFDGIGAGGADGDIDQARAIIEVFEAGFGDAVLISGYQRPAPGPNPGNGRSRLAYLLEWFALTLMEAGAEARIVRRLLIENPRRALTVLPGGG